MKKYLWTIFVLSISVNCLAQISEVSNPKQVKIGVARSGGIKNSELSYAVTGTDTVYLFSYYDKKYSTLNKWNTVAFTGGVAVLDQFHTLLKEALQAEKKSEKSFKLGESTFLVTTQRSLGATYLSIAVSDKYGIVGLTDLMEGQLDKLFGR